MFKEFNAIKDFTFASNIYNPNQGNATVTFDNVDYKAIIIPSPISPTNPWLRVEIFVKDYPNKHNREWFKVYEFATNVSDLEKGFRKFRVKDEDNETYLVDESELVSMAFKDEKQFKSFDLREGTSLFELNHPKDKVVNNGYFDDGLLSR